MQDTGIPSSSLWLLPSSGTLQLEDTEAPEVWGSLLHQLRAPVEKAAEEWLLHFLSRSLYVLGLL